MSRPPFGEGRRLRERAARRRRNALVDLGLGALLAMVCLILFGYAPVAIVAALFLGGLGIRAYRRSRRRKKVLIERSRPL